MIYILKAEWRSTALMLKIEAASEEEALTKANKLKEVDGCYRIIIKGSRPSRLKN